MSAVDKATYIVDSEGHRTAVVLPIEAFEAIISELEDLRDAQYVDKVEASAEGFVSLDDLRQVLRKAS
ncbi:MAG: hypothetical protein ABFD83_02100 [Armatimonadota bacterium]